MSIDVDTPGGKWLKALSTELHNRRIGRGVSGRRWNPESSRPQDRPPLEILENYISGDPPLTGVHEGWKPHIRRFVRMGRLNIADLLVSSTANRMQLRDFTTAAAADELGDIRARELMKANGLSLKAREVHEWMLTFGDAYTLTTPPDSTRDYPLVTAEDPREMITAHDPGTGQIRAALKMFRDEWDSADFAYVFLPGVVKVAVRKSGTSAFASNRRLFQLTDDWEWDDDLGHDRDDNRIPVERFRNRRGVGEFETHLDTLNRINDKIFNEWWIGKIQAFRQRAVRGLPDTVPDPDNPERDIPADYEGLFTASPDEMWRVPSDVEFWESTAVDMGPIVNSIQKDLERLAAAASQPLHTITPDAAKGSAEGASLMREEHVYKIEDRRDRVTPPWGGTMEHVFAFSNNPDDATRAKRAQIEPIWGPVERYSLGEKGSAAAQAKDSLPVETIQTDIWQYPPAKVGDLRALRARELIFQAPGQPGGQPAAG